MIKIGSWVKSQKPELFKKARSRKPRISIFKAGLREFKRSILTHKRHLIWIYFRFLNFYVYPNII